MQAITLMLAPETRHSFPKCRSLLELSAESFGTLTIKTKSPSPVVSPLPPVPGPQRLTPLTTFWTFLRGFRVCLGIHQEPHPYHMAFRPPHLALCPLEPRYHLQALPSLHMPDTTLNLLPEQGNYLPRACQLAKVKGIYL